MRRSLLALLPLSLAAQPALLGAQVPAAEYAARRAALASALPDSALFVALGAPEPARDYDAFTQRPAFRYLTGIEEPAAALVMVKRGDSTGSTLFVLPRDAAREVWTGARPGTAGATRETGLPARPVEELPTTLDSLASLGLPLYVAGDPLGGPGSWGDDSLIAPIARRAPGARARSAEDLIRRLRGTKSDAELALVRKAVAISVAAQREVMRAARPGMNEFELEAVAEYTFRRNGAEGPAFTSIVGSGPNATTLHYSRDDRFIQPGELAVVDIGASYRGYAADVTRTIPASGTFSAAQRDIYQVVRDAQAAAEREAVLGAPAANMGRAARAALAAGLTRLGLIEGPDAVYDAAPGTCARPVQGGGCSQLSLYFMHGIGHGIGLEVHDPDQSDGPEGRIAPGSTFTIEPGLYVRGDALELLPDTPRNRAFIAKTRAAYGRYRGLGVRIEDDYVATQSGVEWISRAPREISDVEAAMREPATAPAPRDSTMVEWYRATAADSVRR